MTKQEFLAKSEVRDFIAFLKLKIETDNSFLHSYKIKKPKNGLWKCTSLYNAYKQYCWPFKFVATPNGVLNPINGFEQNTILLEKLKKDLRTSLFNNNEDDFKRNCLAVLQWGGVLPYNRKRIELTTNITDEFTSAISIFNNPKLDTNDNFDKIHLNAGYTKIYSLLVDDFIIYDGRVGAALGLLTRLFLEENNYSHIPDTLHFAYGAPKIANSNKSEALKRNPSNDLHKFRSLANNSSRHIDNNIRANWLLHKVALESTFSLTSNPLRSIEAALFMIGYDVRRSKE